VHRRTALKRGRGQQPGGRSSPAACRRSSPAWLPPSTCLPSADAGCRTPPPVTLSAVPDQRTAADPRPRLLLVDRAQALQHPHRRAQQVRGRWCLLCMRSVRGSQLARHTCATVKCVSAAVGAHACDVPARQLPVPNPSLSRPALCPPPQDAHVPSHGRISGAAQ